MTEMETLLQRNTIHKNLYNELADEYKKRALNTLVQNDLSTKANRLKNITKGNKILEIGVGGGQMNKLFKDVGFETTGIDIAENMISNAKEMNPGGKFIVGNYLETHMEQKYNLIAGLAFIHLFEEKEARNILMKMYNDLEDYGLIHLTTTKEDKYVYEKCNKQDYGESYVRYRAKHNPDSFARLIQSTPFIFEGLDIEKGADGKEWMSLIAKKK